MVIQRKYEWLGLLIEKDESARLLVDEAFESGNVDKQKQKELLDYNYSNIPVYMDLGCGIPGTVYSNIMDGLKKLDVECPYDNGLTFEDVNNITYETGVNGTVIQMRFEIEKVDMPLRIVGFAAIENTNGKVAINSGWEMATPVNND